MVAQGFINGIRMTPNRFLYPDSLPKGAGASPTCHIGQMGASPLPPVISGAQAACIAWGGSIVPAPPPPALLRG